MARPYRPGDAAHRRSPNGGLFQEPEGGVSERNREATTECAADVPSDSAGAVRRERARWIVFGAVSVLWLPATFAFLGYDWYGDPQFDPVGLLKVVALFSLSGVPLALACGLIRWTGSPAGAWILLAFLGTLVLVGSVAVIAVSSKVGPVRLEDSAVGTGIVSAICSLPIWAGYAILRIGRFWERRAAEAKARRDGGGGSGRPNRPGESPP